MGETIFNLTFWFGAIHPSLGTRPLGFICINRITNKLQSTHSLAMPFCWKVWPFRSGKVCSRWYLWRVCVRVCEQWQLEKVNSRKQKDQIGSERFWMRTWFWTCPRRPRNVRAKIVPRDSWDSSRSLSTPTFSISRFFKEMVVMGCRSCPRGQRLRDMLWPEQDSKTSVTLRGWLYFGKPNLSFHRIKKHWKLLSVCADIHSTQYVNMSICE